MDAVYLCRPGPNPELQYSLRTLAANLPHDRLFVIGGAPDWLDTSTATLVRRPRQSTKYLTTTAHLWWACQPDNGISDPFVLCNDDFYVLRPLASAEAIPFAHQGPIGDVLARHRARGLRSHWLTGMSKTLDRLKARGFAEPLSYELHVPLVVHKAQMLDAMLMGRGITPWHKRSAYGALAERDGVLSDPVHMVDPKVFRVGQPIPAGAFASSTDAAFAPNRPGSLGAFLRVRFPQPSPYETPTRDRTGPKPAPRPVRQMGSPTARNTKRPSLSGQTVRAAATSRAR